MTDVALPQSKIHFFRENGFVQNDDVLTPDELEQARLDLAEAMAKPLAGGIDRTGARSEYDRVFLQKVNLWRDHEGIPAAAFNRGMR